MGSGMSAQRKTVSADSSRIAQTIRNLWPYMWPTDRPDLKLRVLWATIFLVLAKIVLLSVPYFFKWSTDALSGKLDTSDTMAAFALANQKSAVAA